MNDRVSGQDGAFSDLGPRARLALTCTACLGGNCALIFSTTGAALLVLALSEHHVLSNLSGTIADNFLDGFAAVFPWVLILSYMLFCVSWYRWFMYVGGNGHALNARAMYKFHERHVNIWDLMAPFTSISALRKIWKVSKNPEQPHNARPDFIIYAWCPVGWVFHLSFACLLYVVFDQSYSGFNAMLYDLFGTYELLPFCLVVTSITGCLATYLAFQVVLRLTALQAWQIRQKTM